MFYRGFGSNIFSRRHIMILYYTVIFMSTHFFTNFRRFFRIRIADFHQRQSFCRRCRSGFRAGPGFQDLRYALRLPLSRACPDECPGYDPDHVVQETVPGDPDRDQISVFVTSKLYTVRTVVFTCAPAAQKLAKSCSPTRYAAAFCIFSTSSG